VAINKAHSVHRSSPIAHRLPLSFSECNHSPCHRALLATLPSKIRPISTLAVVM